MKLKSFFLSLLGMVDGDAQPAPILNHDARIAAIDSQIQMNLRAIEAKADTCPELLEEATLCLDSITLNLKRETDRLKEGGLK